MKVAELPADEPERLDALDALNIIFSPAEERFDRITRLAKRHFNVPIVLISLVSTEIQWFKSCQGLTASETPREVSFCSHALLMDMPLVINDTQKNPDFADNPLVTGEPHIRFYAGHTIRHMGNKLGTLCVIDSNPREFTAADCDSLRSLAAWVENELENIKYSDTVKQLIENNTQQQRKKLFDPVTGGWNKRGIEQLLNNRFAGNRKPQQLFIMKIGLDEANDTFNSNPNNMVDEILSETAHRIRSVLPYTSDIAYYGNMEFLVVLENSDKSLVRMAAQNILRRINIEPFYVDDNIYTITASIGMACSDDKPDSHWSDLVEVADSALYDAQVEGGNRSILGDHEAQNT